MDQQSSFADPCKDNTLAKIEAYTENFFDRIGRIDLLFLNLPNEINSDVELTGDVANGFINSILGSLQDELARTDTRSNSVTGKISNRIWENHTRNYCD